jgi:NADH-quinone oxidoreductase subunit L
MTHAFFKALLFMAAGVVIHSLAAEQDIRKMGGLRKLMPLTSLAFLIGSLALVGIFPFAGFFSKDSILAAALAAGWYGQVLFAAGMVGALLTGIYAFRLYFIVFTGEPSAFAREHFHKHHGKEGPISMLWTVAVLAVLAVIGGWLQFAPLWTPLTTWLEPVAAPTVEPTDAQEWITSVVGVAVGLTGIAIAWAMYSAKRIKVPKPVTLFEKKFYWDELYDAVFYRGAELVTQAFYSLIEKPLIAGSLTAVSAFFGLGSRDLSHVQNGLVRSYALALTGSVAVLAVVFLVAR